MARGFGLEANVFLFIGYLRSGFWWCRDLETSIDVFSISKHILKNLQPENRFPVKIIYLDLKHQKYTIHKTFQFLCFVLQCSSAVFIFSKL